MPCLSSAGNVLRGNPRLHLPPGERREANKTQEANGTLQCDPHKCSGELLAASNGRRKDAGSGGAN